MQNFNRKEHWENIYHTKKLNEVSWYQPQPETSLSFIEAAQISKTAKIIDIGGGDSFLVDHLLDKGFENISVLDISGAAIQRAKNRLGEAAGKVTWIEADVTSFEPSETYDLWHDRAAFHFLTAEDDIQQYVKNVANALSQGAWLIVGTFSEEGPTKCSGIEIAQYSEAKLRGRFEKYFAQQVCKKADHQTPAGKIQNFQFCSFKRL